MQLFILTSSWKINELVIHDNPWAGGCGIKNNPHLIESFSRLLNLDLPERETEKSLRTVKKSFPMNALKALRDFAPRVSFEVGSALSVQYVFHDRPDHQEKKRWDPVSAGGRGLRGSPQLHLQVRRQVQQVGGAKETIPIKVLFISLYGKILS